MHVARSTRNTRSTGTAEYAEDRVHGSDRRTRRRRGQALVSLKLNAPDLMFSCSRGSGRRKQAAEIAGEDRLAIAVRHRERAEDPVLLLVDEPLPAAREERGIGAEEQAGWPDDSK